MVERGENRRSGKNRAIVVGFLAVMFGVFAIIAYIGATGGGTAGRPEMGPRTAVQPSTHASALPIPTTFEPVSKTISDRAQRDAIRRRILEAWTKSTDESVAGAAATATKGGKLPPMPQTADGGVDPTYIRDVVRTELVPMLAKCYEDMLSRSPDAGGRLVMNFTIAGDDSVGGVVEDAEVDTGDGGLGNDDELATCVRESTMSLAFRPPPQDGWVTVTYPMEFSP